MEPALYLIPVTLGETEISQVLPPYNHDIIVGIKHFIVENIRSARRFLKKTEKHFFLFPGYRLISVAAKRLSQTVGVSFHWTKESTYTPFLRLTLTSL